MGVLKGMRLLCVFVTTVNVLYVATLGSISVCVFVKAIYALITLEPGSLVNILEEIPLIRDHALPMWLKDFVDTICKKMDCALSVSATFSAVITRFSAQKTMNRLYSFRTLINICKMIRCCGKMQ